MAAHHTHAHTDTPTDNICRASTVSRRLPREEKTHQKLHVHTCDFCSGSPAPVGINPLEHEEMPMSARPAVPQITTGRPGGTFTHVTALPLTFCVKPDAAVSLYRARLDNRDVVLRVLRGTCQAVNSTQTSRSVTAGVLNTKHVPQLQQRRQTTARGSTSWGLRHSCQDWGHTPSYLLWLVWCRGSRL